MSCLINNNRFQLKIPIPLLFLRFLRLFASSPPSFVYPSIHPIHPSRQAFIHSEGNSSNHPIREANHPFILFIQPSVPQELIHLVCHPNSKGIIHPSFAKRIIPFAKRIILAARQSSRFCHPIHLYPVKSRSKIRFWII